MNRRRYVSYFVAAVLASAGTATARAQYAAPQAATTTYAVPQAMTTTYAAPPAVQVVTVERPWLIDRCLARLGERLVARGQTTTIKIRMQAAPPPPAQVYIVPATSAPQYWQAPPPATYAAPQAMYAPPPATYAAPQAVAPGRSHHGTAPGARARRRRRRLRAAAVPPPASGR